MCSRPVLLLEPDSKGEGGQWCTRTRVTTITMMLLCEGNNVVVIVVIVVTLSCHHWACEDERAGE